MAVNGKVIEPIFTEPIQLINRISKSIGNSKEKKVSDIDIAKIKSYLPNSSI
jgi:hypothetical protein